MKKIGVFICHCGINIAKTVDVEALTEEMKKYPGVVHAENYTYMCSDPGQNLVINAIKEKGLDAVVVAACSPTLHENTFRNTSERGGLNRYVCEMANIREHCSWVHDDKEVATRKAAHIIKSIVEKVRYDEPLEPIHVEVTKRALVIGGGIAGIQAALDIANAGVETILVEKSPSVGGRMAQLSETFPTLDCSQCILTPKMVEVSQHKNIKLMAYSEVEEISGSVGNFKAKIKKKASYIDHVKCTGCGICYEKCPIKVDSEFEEGLGKRKAIYTPFPQAVPNIPIIDAAHCTYFLKPGKCKVCQIVCPTKAVDFEQKDEIIEEDVGAIVVATGFDLYSPDKLKEYGYGSIPDVITSLQFERLLSASGPTTGDVKRISDGKVPKRVVFIQCAGSRDKENHLEYCSKICCMYTAKHALLYKHRVHDGEPIIFYIDVRTAGKGYEEFYNRVTDEGTIYIRGKVSKVYQDNGRIIVLGADTLSGKQVEVEADMVVLALGMVPKQGSEDLVRRLKIQCDANEFLTEAHPKLRPVESQTAGIYLAGAAQGPKDIPEVVAQASGAASKAIAILTQKEITFEPTIAGVDEDLCSGCGICVGVCPYNARELDREKMVVKVIESLCQGCGSCSAACPSGAAQQRNLIDRQIEEMVVTALGEK
ncbi:CoB--CoM heterodisulfide reductase iron-sulfur subunit A family protein [candidate division WOR-3 bacterium]|jgi:heterodisulfide reductase subunit A|nr:CoB--CoM heterodisulfide reductase iron-sulfur subunit A family protein [candidate division WOR-3 bacterium]